jgi:hypothetical protein
MEGLMSVNRFGNVFELTPEEQKKLDEVLPSGIINVIDGDGRLQIFVPPGSQPVDVTGQRPIRLGTPEDPFSLDVFNALSWAITASNKKCYEDYNGVTICVKC